jgi:phosphoesterase RecJ-like protein
MLSIQKVVESINQRRSFLIATHVNPDGDAIGSLLALTSMLHRLGKEAHPYCQDPAPAAQTFLPGARSIRNGGAQPSQYEAAVLVDCGDLHRVGPALSETVQNIPLLINIDHHVTSAPFGDVYWVKPEASSTCEMLYDLSEALSISMDPDLATQLYTGILTDTGSFRFSNTSRRVLEIAARLVAAGAEPARIAEYVYDSASPQRLRLLSRVLSTVVFNAEDRLATAELTRQMFAETGTSEADSEGFINHLRSVGTVDVAILFREDKNGAIHVSMRSKGKVDVATFAQERGGGGHRNAAAFRAPGDMRSISARVTREMLDYIAQGDRKTSTYKKISSL